MSEASKQFKLYLFNEQRRVINAEHPVVANGVTVQEIAPTVIANFERYPIGTITSITVYADGEFEAYYSAADYLEQNIPKVWPAKKKT